MHAGRLRSPIDHLDACLLPSREEQEGSRTFQRVSAGFGATLQNVAPPPRRIALKGVGLHEQSQSPGWVPRRRLLHYATDRDAEYEPVHSCHSVAIGVAVIV